MSSEYDDDDRSYRDDRWDDDRGSRTPPSMPGSVKAAGILWILFGVAGIIMQILNFAILAAEQAQNQQQAPGSSSTGCCGMIFAIAFLVVGIQTLRGTAKDTLGNSIGSLIFAAIYLGLAVLMIVLGKVIVENGNLGNNGQPLPAGAADNDELMMIMIFSSVFLVGLGSILLLAGVLALVGRSGYLAWRRATKSTSRPSRRRYEEERDDDDYDDRDDEEYDRRRDR